MDTAYFKYPLGVEAKDTITGFVGIIESRSQDLTGCNRYLLTPKAKNNDAAKTKGMWVHEATTEVLSKKPKVQPTPAGPSAG